MLSHQLIRNVEDHWQEILSATWTEIQKHPEMPHVNSLPESEVKTWGQKLLKNLGDMIEGGDDTLAWYVDVGRRRYEMGIPLHESVRAKLLLKERILNWVRERGFAGSTLEIYAEEELEHKVGMFFDRVLFHLVKGYECALRDAVRGAVETPKRRHATA